jgi:hypothetical protein
MHIHRRKYQNRAVPTSVFSSVEKTPAPGENFQLWQIVKIRNLMEISHFTVDEFLEPLSILTKYKTSVTPKIDNIFIFIYVLTIFQSSSG